MGMRAASACGADCPGADAGVAGTGEAGTRGSGGAGTWDQQGVTLRDLPFFILALIEFSLTSLK